MDQFLQCPSDLSLKYFEALSFTVSTVRMITSLVFLILPWFSQYFLYRLNETLSLSEPLYFCTIVAYKGGSPLPRPPALPRVVTSVSLKIVWSPKIVWTLLHDLPPKMHQSCLLPLLRKKCNERHCIWNNKSEHTKFT